MRAENDWTTAQVAQYPDRLRAFRAATEHHMAITVYMCESVSKKRTYGARNADVFLNQLIPSAHGARPTSTYPVVSSSKERHALIAQRLRAVGLECIL